MKKELYGRINGREVYLYTISDGAISVAVCDCGARVNALTVNGADVALGFNGVKTYSESGTYAGAIVGRVANRIAGGRFVLNGKPYFLNKNDGGNHLHGGFIGFDKKVFEVLSYTENSVEMQYVSADGEENYPGTLSLTVKFTVEKKGLKIEFSGICDKDTLWGPTSHSYFNLDGEDGGDCRGNVLKINAEYYTPVNGENVPFGNREAVAGTPFDFRTLKPIGKDAGAEQLARFNGYDVNFILGGEHAAHAESEKTGIKLDVFTDLPCLQLYTGGVFEGFPGKTRKYYPWAGFCLEPQFCPNAVNLNGFAKPIIKKNTVNKHYIYYKFEY